jgi:hypothetical protein
MRVQSFSIRQPLRVQSGTAQELLDSEEIRKACMGMQDKRFRKNHTFVVFKNLFRSHILSLNLFLQGPASGILIRLSEVQPLPSRIDTKSAANP